ncbi:branched-chain amino acid ABC transporter permease [Brucella pseudogrignonensis]|uniref:branched-chain amino acid ABC transporter permease n=1 Tax=Brucella pseudogrignonensis TaxID=419475 RepID=UPI000CFA82BD|nr:branched-chain amino acid ABC transporter permease [Brucella pseudogrignonensis]MQP40336.1 branched-chain amino acid ABC transporter permease [Ochrobactrum sp. MYb237]PQZ39416.1 branched-chain amino acid ABC transporter permease [Brucella pseudogrignonensis]PRA41082.1 branched-chain amino acid ABC transporter permease [Brucella pseudogrignonensis]PRA69908.1 branched-chain amino acid ABC transporter permease [Brucella pseudogrignonensis]
MSYRMLLIVAGCGLLALFPLAADALGQNAATNLVARIMIYAIAAASLNLILGYGGMVSFGHAAFFGIGSYVVGILYFHHAEDTLLFGFIPGSDQFPITVAAAVLVSGIAALFIGALALRTSGVQFIMITLAFAQMLFFLFVSLKTYGGEDGIIVRQANDLFGISLRDKTTMYYVILVSMILYLSFLWRVVHSSYGAVLSGIRQSERRMTAMGIETYRYKLYGFVLAGMGAGLAGALLTIFMRFASPDTLHWTKSGELMVMVILGGVGSFFGPLWGAAAFLILQTYLASWTEHWQLAMGLVLLLVVMATKGGIVGAWLRIRHWSSRLRKVEVRT